MSLTPNETYQLLDAGSPEDVDAAFVSLYEAEDGSYFQEVTRDLLDREVLAPWRPLLDQVISAYQRLDFAITIPALLTVCEGVLMSGRGNETDMRVNLGSLANGAPATISVVVTLTAASGTVLTDTATVAASTQDLNSRNNSATKRTTVSRN
jgi:hypothetical protein